MMRPDFIERSIRGALSFIKQSIFADETAGLPGLLQRLDPRIKTATIALFLLTALFSRSLEVLVALYLLTVLLAALSKIKLGFFLKRTWIFIPLFSLMIAVPALFSFISPGKPVISAGALSITGNGIMAAAFFVGRVIVSVSLVVLLSMTTRHFVLLAALRRFGTPQLFVMVLGMCYRYIYLLIEIVENTHRAIRSRIGFGMRYREGQNIVSWNIANLWIRSVALNEQVYSAMVSRGFRGEPIILNRFRTKPRDWLWLCGTVAIIILLAYAEHRTRI